MTSEMSAVQEAFNPFEMLSDEPILHIFSFLPGADLLKLYAMHTNFYRIITTSPKTISKIRLVLDIYKHENPDLDFLIKLAQTRKFTALQLTLVHYTYGSAFNRTDAAEAKLSSLLQLLSGSVDDLVVYGRLSPELLTSIIAKFLPKLKKCTLGTADFVSDADEARNLFKEISQQSIVNPRLASLELDCHDAGFASLLFAGCNHLKTFCCKVDEYDADNAEHMNDFLAKQDHLEKLIVPDVALPWNRLKCYPLKELETTCKLDDAEEMLAAAEFLKKLPKLTKLDLTVFNHPPHQLMKAICGIPKLEKLTFGSYDSEDEDDDAPEDMLERLENRSVKELEITPCSGITAKLLKIFLGVESIYLYVRDSDVLDLSYAPPEAIKKIKINCYSSSFVVKFGPSEIPTNVKLFESAVMKFAKENSNLITGIEIGNVNWRRSRGFRLSNSFCEGLVNQLPKLEKLEVYNIADSPGFIKFLIENEYRLKLKIVNLHEPLGAGERKPSKMEIRIM